MIIEVPEVSGQLLLDKTPGEASVAVARVATARDFAASRPQADPVRVTDLTIRQRRCPRTRAA